MGVIMSAGIGVGRASGAIFFDMSAIASATAEQVKPIKGTAPEELAKHLPWSYWGCDNLLPRQYIRDIDKTHIVNSIVHGKGIYTVNEGVLPVILKSDGSRKVIDKIVDAPEITEFLEMNDTFDNVDHWARDLAGFSWAAGRFKLNTRCDKIVLYQRDDLTECRFEKKNKITKRSMNLYYSADWDKVYSPKDNRVDKYQLLDPKNRVEDLREKALAGIVDHAFTFGTLGWGKHYYPTPMWMAAYQWVKIAQGVPEMKAALFANAMRPKMQVIILEDYWEEKYGDTWPDDVDEQDKLKQATFDEIDKYLVGTINANKAIYTTGYRDENGKIYSNIEFRPIEDSTKPGELLPDAAAANSEIAIAMLWNNAETGGNQKAGILQSESGGSNIRESGLRQVINMEPQRQKIRSAVFNTIKYFNKWDKTYPGLDFIIPATILTTTDTGSGTKPIATGGVNSKDKKEEANAD